MEILIDDNFCFYSLQLANGQVIIANEKYDLQYLSRSLKEYMMNMGKK